MLKRMLAVVAVVMAAASGSNAQPTVVLPPSGSNAQSTVVLAADGAGAPSLRKFDAPKGCQLITADGTLGKIEFYLAPTRIFKDARLTAPKYGDYVLIARVVELKPQSPQHVDIVAVNSKGREAMRLKIGEKDKSDERRKSVTMTNGAVILLGYLDEAEASRMDRIDFFTPNANADASDYFTRARVRTSSGSLPRPLPARDGSVGQSAHEWMLERARNANPGPSQSGPRRTPLPKSLQPTAQPNTH